MLKYLLTLLLFSFISGCLGLFEEEDDTPTAYFNPQTRPTCLNFPEKCGWIYQFGLNDSIDEFVIEPYHIRTFKIENQIWTSEYFGASFSKNEDGSENFQWKFTYDQILNGDQPNDLDTIGVRGICPRGYHIPSKYEWQKLFDTVASMFGVHPDSILQIDKYFGTLKNHISYEECGDYSLVFQKQEHCDIDESVKNHSGLHFWGYWDVEEHGAERRYADFYVSSETPTVAKIWHINATFLNGDRPWYIPEKPNRFEEVSNNVFRQLYCVKDDDQIEYVVYLGDKVSQLPLIVPVELPLVERDIPYYKKP